MFYYSLINLSSGELSPVNEIEFAWFNFSLMLSIFLFSFYFSNMTSLLIDLNFAAIMSQLVIDESNSVMTAIEVEFESKADVRMFFKMNEYTQKFQNDFDSLLTELPHTCCIKVIFQLYNEVLHRNSVMEKTMDNLFNTNKSLFSRLNKAFHKRLMSASNKKGLL